MTSSSAQLPLTNLYDSAPLFWLTALTSFLFMRSQLLATIAFASGLLALNTPAYAISLPKNDYPTEARADYIFACMQVNGQTRDSLIKCSCSIDTVASLIPYADYASARTILMMLNSTNRYRDMFRSYGPFKEKVTNLKHAQVEGELRCF